jgi:hypothetical protein
VPWRFTGFYGQPDWTKRRESWALLRHLKDFQPDPWLCCGDFNEIVAQHEKVGGAHRKEEQMNEFRVALEVCNLSDMGYRGAKFTWNNRQHNEDFIKERLDRVVGNKEWMGLFSDVMVQVLSTNVSDHKPLLIAMMKETEDRRVRSSGFKFEASWLLDEEYNRVVQEVWIETEGGITAIGTVQEKLAPCQTKLKNWSSRKFGQAEKVLKEKTKALEVLQRNEGLENVEEIKCLQGEIDYILDQEDVKWKQRGKQNWFREGDRNTSFFNA